MLSLLGKMLHRGMWLYVWRVETPKGEMLYVGLTGDSNSPHATAPYTRMGQHLGLSKAANSLRRLLVENGVVPEDCARFALTSQGPIYPEIGLKKDQIRHEQMRLRTPVLDKMAELEKKLSDEPHESGYRVLNVVHSKKEYDKDVWNDVRAAFAVNFQKLTSGTGMVQEKASSEAS